MFHCTFSTANDIKTISTLPHDSLSILPSIKNINTTEPYNQVGDAGFIVDRDILPWNVNQITAKRKNQLIRNTPVEKAKIKQFNRIHIRRDWLIVSNMGFVNIALMKII